MRGQVASTPKGRRTSKRIVDAATRLVLEQGVRATSLDDIRASAGVSKSQLYHYFAAKDDLTICGHRSTVDLVLESQP